MSEQPRIATLELLRRLDRTGGSGPNPGAEEWARSPSETLVRTLYAPLEEVLGVTFPRGEGTNIQDASFFANITLPPSLFTREALPGYRPGLVFSNFGGLVAIDFEEHLPEPTITAISGVLTAAGFCLVPRRLYDSPYDGICTNDAGEMKTWYDRLFSWGYPELPESAA